jgi:hypothetical protein
MNNSVAAATNTLVWCLGPTVRWFGMALAVSPLLATLAAEPEVLPKIHHVAGGPDEVFASAYIIECQSGTVVTDALLTRSAFSIIEGTIKIDVGHLLSKLQVADWRRPLPQPSSAGCVSGVGTRILALHPQRMAISKVIQKDMPLPSRGTTANAAGLLHAQRDINDPKHKKEKR